MPHAVQVLVQIMADKDAKESARVSAALGLMKYGRESIELDDVVERMERIEADLATRKKAGSNGYAADGA